MAGDPGGGRSSGYLGVPRGGGPAGAGAAGYDPDMLVTLLIWAYAQGVTSSRRIEAACCRMWLPGDLRGQVPDHVTIARFRAAFPGRRRSLFAQVLVLCARLGMGQLGTVALDGTKIAANASKAANRTEETLRKLAAERAARRTRQRMRPRMSCSGRAAAVMRCRRRR